MWARARASIGLGAARRLMSSAASSPKRGRRLAAATAVCGGGAALLSASGLLSQNTVEAKASPGRQDDVQEVDALIVGGGIMSASVGVMLKLLHPTWKVLIVEKLDKVGAESSNEWHNAGTGHAAMCEPNYTPMDPKTNDVNIDKAIMTNSKFLVSLQWWSWLVEKGILPDAAFIQPAPHVTFVYGEENLDWLRKRVKALRKLPTFAPMEHTEDFDKIKEWVPLLCSGRDRKGVPIGATRHPHGSECNYGLLTRNLIQSFHELGGEVQLLSNVEGLTQEPDKKWLVDIKKNDLSGKDSQVRARLVFAGAGGGSLKVLQLAKIPEIRGYGGMPVSGKFLVCQKSEIVEKHRNKVYGRAALGSPPMSVPHLDWRTIYGQDCIFFGPFAGFSPAVFKCSGSLIWDWIGTFNFGNVIPFLAMSLQNLDLCKYLIGEVFSSKTTQLKALREFIPDAKAEDWTMVWAGQRLQICMPQPAPRFGKLEFGTKVLASADNTLIGLLGASPGASVSPHIAIEVLSHFECAVKHEAEWHAALAQMIPSYGRDINANPKLYDDIITRARDILWYGKTSGHRTGMKNAEALFDRIDEKHDGILSEKDMRAHLKKSGVADASIEAIITKLASKDHTISREKFIENYGNFITGQVKTA